MENQTCTFNSMALFSVVCNEYSENTGIEVDQLVRVKYIDRIFIFVLLFYNINSIHFKIRHTIRII